MKSINDMKTSTGVLLGAIFITLLSANVVHTDSLLDRGWPVLEATIVDAKINKGRDTYQKLTYSYTVEGEKYSDKDTIYSLSDQGETIEIVYNPDYREESYINQKDGTGEFSTITGLIVIALSVGTKVVFRLRRKNKINETPSIVKN